MGMEVATSNHGRASALAHYTGLKVFSATKAKERELLGEAITDWIAVKLREHTPPGAARSRFSVVETVVTQSSDSEFHCLTITVFYAIAPLESNGKRS